MVKPGPDDTRRTAVEGCANALLTDLLRCARVKGHFKKRGSSWYFWVELEPGPDGKRRQKSRGGFKTRREAERDGDDRCDEERTQQSPHDDTLSADAGARPAQAHRDRYADRVMRSRIFLSSCLAFALVSLMLRLGEEFSVDLAEESSRLGINMQEILTFGDLVSLARALSAARPGAAAEARST